MVKSHAISCRARKYWGRPVSLKSEMHIDNNKLDFPSFESKKETACSSLIPYHDQYNGTKRSRIAAAREEDHEETKGDRFSNEDITMEVLSRLPVEFIHAVKCVCKQWYELLSRPSFRSAHFQNSEKTISGLILQKLFCCGYCGTYQDLLTGYVSFGEDQINRNSIITNGLDFLPEKAVIVASCNGLLLCRHIYEVDYPFMRTNPEFKEVVLYVCNPFTKEWTTLKSKDKYEYGCRYGFKHNPVGSSGNPDFEVVLVQPYSPYQFEIYSSKLGAWRKSKEVYTMPEKLLMRQSCFANGVFYWLTTDHSILTFDLKQEKSHVINLPGNMMMWNYHKTGICLGVSEGRLHYICFNMIQLMVWMLKYDNLIPKWDLIYVKPQLEMPGRQVVCRGGGSYGT